MQKNARRAHFIASALLALALSACGGGGSGSKSPAPPPPDTTSPETTISVAPGNPSNSASASITFTANETGATFESRLDGAAFAAATSPQTVAGLADGSHTFDVRARDIAGNIDASPATATWIVDTVAPDTTLSAGPSGALNVAASFTFSSPDTTATFEGSLDNAAYVAITSPYVAAGLTDATHTMRIRARDAAGNVDATPASATWIMDTVAPSARVVFPTAVSYTQASTLTVRGSAQDTNSVAEVRVNGVLATSANNFASWSAVVPIAAGTNNLVVSAKDSPGNTAAAAASVQVSNRGPTIQLGRALDYDPNGNRIIVADQGTHSLYGYSTISGLGTVIANLRALDPLPDSPALEQLVVDAANNRALVMDEFSDRVIGVSLANGAFNVVSPKAGADVAMSYSGAFALDGAHNRLFVSVPDTKTVFSINLATGVRTVVSSPSVGTGSTANYQPAGIVYDDVSNPATPRLLVANADLLVSSIVAIDIATGNRVTFSSASPLGTGPVFGAAYSLSLDAAHSRVLVLDLLMNALYAVALPSGDRSILARSTVGTGAAIHESTGLALNPTTQRAYFGQTGGEVMEVDLTTQIRSNFVSPSLGTGPRFNGPRSPVIERTGGQPSSILAIDLSPDRLVRINLANGNRTIISGADDLVGSGNQLSEPIDLVLDARAPAPNSRALVIGGGVLVSVDLGTGDRTQLAYLNSVGPNVNQPRALVLDTAANRVLFIDNDNGVANADAIYAIDLATGNRTTISSGSVGTSGPNATFALPTDLVLEPAVNPTRVLVTNASGVGQPANILAVSLANGNRSEFVAGYNVGIGPAITLPVALVLDTTNSRLLGMNAYNPFLFAVPLTAPVRQMISGTYPGLETVTGTGFTWFGSGIDADTVNGVAFTFAGDGSLMAIDTVSGDRVLISH